MLCSNRAVLETLHTLPLKTEKKQKLNRDQYIDFETKLTFSQFSASFQFVLVS